MPTRTRTSFNHRHRHAVQLQLFRPLLAVQPEDQIIRVKGTCAKTQRLYELEHVAPKLQREQDFDFNGFLDDLEDPSRLQRILNLPRGWFHMPRKRQLLVQNLLATN